ncbi:MAG: hypothetical protein ACTSWN_08155 [Promethearchaeota archaeon]
MVKKIFILDRSCEPYVDIIIKSIKYACRIYKIENKIVNCTTELDDENVITISVADKLPGKRTIFVNPRAALGCNEGNKIILRTILFTPEKVFAGQEDLLNKYDTQRSVNITFLHEFQELLLAERHPTWDVHNLLMHFGGDTKCINNFDIDWDFLARYADLTLEQMLLFLQTRRGDTPYEHHKNLIKRCL